MNLKQHLLLILITVALAAGVSTTSGQTLVYSNDFQSTIGLTPFRAVQMSNPGQQLVLTSTVSSPLDTNNASATFGNAYPSTLFPPALLPDQQTLELRVDLVSANQNDAFAYLQWWVPSWTGDGKGYALFKDQDEIGLIKTWNDVAANACFFWTNAPLKNQNVILALTFTRVGSDLRITSRVLDKDNANAVLFELTVTDTPQSDPVLPTGAGKGVPMEADIVAAPWVLENRGNAILGIWWGNTQSAPQPDAEVIFDNLQVWQYESPQLTIADAVLLSWPVTTGQFILESAPSLTGSWTPVADPLTRTNNGVCEVSVSTTDDVRFFRLRFAP